MKERMVVALQILTVFLIPMGQSERACEGVRGEHTTQVTSVNYWLKDFPLPDVTKTTAS